MVVVKHKQKLQVKTSVKHNVSLMSYHTYDKYLTYFQVRNKLIIVQKLCS